VISCLLLILSSMPGYVFAGSEDRILKNEIGEMPDGTPVYLYKITNKNGMSASVMSYGGIMTELLVPDRNGKLEDILLGYRTLEEYIKTGNLRYFNTILGRYANRIANGRLELDGKVYQLSINEEDNTLHGGVRGFDKRVWDAKEVRADGAVGVELSYLSKDGEEGFPGNVRATVTYWLTDSNEIHIDYKAVTDQETVVNLSQHNYYNLKGEGNGNILDHVLTLHADHFTPVDKETIPTGEIRSVAGTGLDFRTPRKIGSRIHSKDPQIQLMKGYDFNYVLNRREGTRMQHAATVYETETGRRMDVFTTQPGVQLYTSNKLDGSDVGKSGKAYMQYAGLCLETQHFPDSPNHPNFPSTVLVPGQTYSESAIFKFSVDR
jgi:galactose mutarotase